MSELKFLCITRELARPQSGNLPGLVLKTVSHQLRGRQQDTNASFCHWQLRNAEQVKERNMSAKFCVLVKEFASLFCLSFTEQELGIQGGHLAGSHTHEELQL